MINQDECTIIIEKIRELASSQPKDLFGHLLAFSHTYENHRCYPRIATVIGEYLVSSFSPDAIRMFCRRVNNPEPVLENLLSDVNDHIRNKEYTQASKIMSGILPFAYDLKEKFENTDNLAFRDFIEFAYYIRYISPEDDRPVYPYLWVEIFCYHGILLREMGDLDESLTILSKIQVRSPVNSLILLELAEIYRIKNNLDDFYNNSLLALKYSWKGSELSRAFRNMGYYYSSKMDYDPAIVCHLITETWDSSVQTSHELAYISEKSGKEIDISWYNIHGKEILRDHNLPQGPNPEMIEIMVDYADECIEEGDLLQARRYLILANDLIMRDDIEKKIEIIESTFEDMTIF